MSKILVFDMDGTIADLYAVDNWLDALNSHDATPFKVAEPMYDMAKLACVLHLLKYVGYKVIVTSWLSAESDKDFDTAVRKAKREWLDNYGFPYDEIHIIKYGTTKANCTRKYGTGQILIDDNEKVRRGWTLGDTIDASTVDIFHALVRLLSNEYEKWRV